MKSKFSLVLGVFSVVLFSCTDIDLDVSEEKEVIEILGQSMQSPESDEAIEIANTVIDEYLATMPVKINGINKVSAMVAKPVVELISEKGVFPESYVIDFGDGYYMNSKNKTISGKIYFTKSDKVGTFRTYRFYEFYIDKTNIKSYRTIERKDEIKEGNELKISASDTVTFANGSSYLRKWERTRKLIGSNGNVTEYWNNSYEYEGSGSGTTLKKTKYEMKIQKPLVSLAGYKYYVSGVVMVKAETGEQFIDFGKGEKDNIATVKTNGKEKEVKLDWE